MDFALNDIQRMLQDSASRFIQNDYDFDKRRSLVESDLGYSKENWAMFAELGWLGLPFTERVGGLDGSLVDMIVLQEQFGRGLVVEPYLSTVILGGNLVQRHGTDQQQSEMLNKLIEGELQLAFACFEPTSQSNVLAMQTSVKAENGVYRLSGHKAVVLGAPSADLIVVAARSSGGIGDRDGISLFLVKPDQQGVEISTYTTNDGNKAADIVFNDVLVQKSDRLGDADTAFDAIRATLNDAVVALAAQAVGLMDRLLDATVEYSQVRKQFDQPISRFQVLQHRMAEMFMECQQSRSMLYFGAITVSKNQQGGAEDSDRAASMLKIKIGKSGRMVGQAAIQLHGGMGVSDELDVGHYFKSLTMINTLFGSQDEHLRRLVAHGHPG